jgi:hypothetical protein
MNSIKSQSSGTSSKAMIKSAEDINLTKLIQLLK